MVDLTGHWIGLVSVAIFVVAYAVLIAEEQLALRKSVPLLIAAGLIWALIELANLKNGDTHAATRALEQSMLEFAELFLFLIVAMTFVNTIEERGVFNAVRVWLLQRGLSYQGVFWVTGCLTFLISPIADNLTTALLMGAIVIAVGRGNSRFTTAACVNIVVAANAGGAFSPFGDITTLMVWQNGRVAFADFFHLVLPSLINWLIPAALMAWTIRDGKPALPEHEKVWIKAGGLGVVVLFVVTIGLTVILHSLLDLPPALGMTFGLGLLKVYSYLFNRFLNGGTSTNGVHDAPPSGPALGLRLAHDPSGLNPREHSPAARGSSPIETFRHLERVEWDTLLFLYGVILCVGGMGALGYLTLLSTALYVGLGPTLANILIGLISALIDNVPVMFAVLSMNQELSQGQWLLVTLTTGVGGSLLCIGSAAGVALMGQARGTYTFMSHLRWTWAIALGYAASIGVHLLINRALF